MPCSPKKCPPKVDPGRLNTLVTVQRQVQTPAPGAGFDRQYITIGTMWCDVVQLTGREYFTDQQLRQGGDHSFTTRWANVVAVGLKDTDRLTMENKIDPSKPHVFQIRSIQDVEYYGTVALVLGERNVPT